MPDQVEKQTSGPEIVVAGDMAIDWLQWPVAAKDIGESDEDAPDNWELVPGHRMIAREGGAMLQTRMVTKATGKTEQEVLGHEIPQTIPGYERKLEEISPKEVLHSLSFLADYPRFANHELQEKDKRRVYRVQKLCGFIGPPEGPPGTPGLPDDALNANPRMIVLDDAGNGFRRHREVWPKALFDGRDDLRIVMKMSRPLAQGDLWNHVTSKYADRLVVVVNADDLRLMPGVNVCRRLSWERTARDFGWQMVNNQNLAPLAALRHLVVRFAIDGAIYYTHGPEGPRSVLYYDQVVGEGGFSGEHPGQMLGYSSAFVAAIAAKVLQARFSGPDADVKELVGEGVMQAILCCRRLLQHGFGEVPKKSSRRAFAPKYPVDKVFRSGPADRPISKVPVPSLLISPDDSCSVWSILQERQDGLEDLAYTIVEEGVDSEGDELQGLPIAQFGQLKTADLSEIESYRSIKNIISEYHQSGSAESPLCIAVFGPPGSGKSFGVMEVAQSIAPDDIETTEFNLAQFGSPGDLTRALHHVQDTVLGSKLPLVFFDEFDSPCGGGELGWLRYLLMPMHDGKFRDGETTHPLGKAIFVFAGGTRYSLADFARENIADPEEARRQQEIFRKCKGPDFVSRLRGHIDILGPNPLNTSDHFVMIRRAVGLRTLLERKAKELKRQSDDKANYLIDGDGKAHIDRGVLRAFIKVPRYKHGMRSMVAIIEMSMLGGKPHFEQAALPAPEQLDLHVKAKDFCRLILADVPGMPFV